MRFALYLPLCLVLLLLFSACKDNGNPINGNPPTIPIDYPAVDSYPAWSPDGSKILYNHYGITKILEGGMFFLNLDSSGLWIMNPDGSNQRMLLKGFAIYADWSPDGQWIAFEQGWQIYKVPFVADSVDRSRIQQLTFQGENFFPAWSSDPDGGAGGQWIAYDSNFESPNGMNFIWKMKADGSQKRRITYEPTMGEIRMPHWSPDGRKITHIRYLVGTFSSEIFVMDSSGANPLRLTLNRSTDYHPKYSPDGTKIVFQSQASGEAPQIWVMDADGRNRLKLTNTGGETPSWSPDGTKIVYIGYKQMGQYHPQENGTVWVMNADGTNKRQLTFGPSLQ